MPAMEQGLQITHINFRIFEDFRKQTGADGLTCMNRNNGASSIWMLKKMMAASDPDHLKASFGETANQILATESREFWHD